jgi:hypothetical protein
MHNSRSAILPFDPKTAPPNPFGIPKYFAGSLGHGRGVRLPSVTTAVHFVSMTLDHADLFIWGMALFMTYFGKNHANRAKTKDCFGGIHSIAEIKPLVFHSAGAPIPWPAEPSHGAPI